MSDILITRPSYEMVKCDSCTNLVPFALAFRVEDERDRHMLACSERCAFDIAGKLRIMAGYDALNDALDRDGDSG